MRAAVLGSPVGHSLSPALHQAAYAHLGLSDWTYRAIECTSEGLPALIDAARSDPEFGGFSLTMPLKVVALPLVHELEPLAERVAAVNTVVRRVAGLYGANTDVPGMVNALREARITRVEAPLVLGGGGSAQAALAALALMGARTVRVAVRDRRRAAGLAGVSERVGIQLEMEDLSSAGLDDADLVVSTVPAGGSQMLAEWAAGWVGGWSPDVAFFDLVYAPWPTPLAQVAASAGACVLGGLDLLAHQAVGQVKLMTGRDVDVSVLRAAGERALSGLAR